MPHTIRINKSKGTWVVRSAGAVIAESANALELLEGTAPGVIYFPRDDVAMEFLEQTESSTQCPFKGTASYFSIHGKSGVLPDAAWSYERPLANASAIAGHLAFYGNKVVVEQV